ncbi:hypothetical protein RV01_GL001211 [Enterococcus dispar]|nr:hypothetical protein RV01_GL001211 [Enterococcus dispar]
MLSPAYPSLLLYDGHSQLCGAGQVLYTFGIHNDPASLLAVLDDAT